MKERNIYSFFLILVSVWWGWTVLVDFFVVRTVFSVISNFWEAGELGITVFSKLNHLEVIVSTFLVALLGLQTKRKKEALPLLLLALVTWAITLFYFSYLIPKIVFLTDLWEKSDLMGTSSIAGIPDIQQEHQFFHRIYIWTDTVKLLVLTSIMAIGIKQQEKMF